MPPLPGSPDGEGMAPVLNRALTDATALERGGVDAVLVENFGDAPFYPEDVPKHTVASMTRVATELADAVSVPLGVNVLRNDVGAAIAVADATGGRFVRANVHTGVRVTDQGVVEGRAHETIRFRAHLDADVAVFADVDVKHSTPVSARYDPVAAVEDVLDRGLADGVIVSGRATGESPSLERVRRMKTAACSTDGDSRVLVGSGVTPETVTELVDVADGAIVGSAFKPGGDPRAPVAESRVRRLVDRARESQE